MRMLILGGDGYLGWPTAMRFAAEGAEVSVVDNYLRREIAAETESGALVDTPRLPERSELFFTLTKNRVRVYEGDCCDWEFISSVFEEVKPDCVIHYAEQPSAPYSMRGFDEARLTLKNNIDSTFNLIWCVLKLNSDCHIIKLGTMGEYGTPNIDIEEGWIDIEHKGRQDRFLFPRQASSLYHTSKILDTDLLWFYARLYGLRVTDLMQGPVYGISTPEADLDSRLMPNFHYDDIFGTVVNRFVVQAVAGIPLTVYGAGNQVRGYLNILDTLQCVELAAASPPDRGELRVFNQFTETFSVNELATRIADAAGRRGINVEIAHLDNPRKESEDHYYNPAHSGLRELGLQPHPLTDDVIGQFLGWVGENKGNIRSERIMPRVSWRDAP